MKTKLRFAARNSLGLFLLSGALTAGCTESSSIVDFPYDSKEDIGGVEALGSTLNAIGTVGMLDEEGAYSLFCTASLIGPSTVLTAKHCAEVMEPGLLGMKLVNLVPIYFAVGPDATQPVRMVEAVASDLSPLDEGGFVGLGNDVALYHLVEPITDVTPIAVGKVQLADDDVGTKFIGVGYGSKDVFEDLTGELSGHRRLGTKTMQALEGKSFELMLGSFDALFEQLAFELGSELAEMYRAEIQAWYDGSVIFQGYEAWAGYAPGDSQSCHGDSGGPLVGKLSNGSSAVFGVVSGGWYSRDLTCDYGTFYATMGDKTQQMIEQGLKWTDPCAGHTVEGRCEGSEAVRCTTKWEGNRRVTRTNCASVGMNCGSDDAGQVACVDPGSPTPPAHIDPAAGRTAPSTPEVRRLVMQASRRAALQPVMQRLGAAK